MINNQRKEFQTLNGFSERSTIFVKKIKEIDDIEKQMSELMLKIVESNVHGENHNWFGKLKKEL